MKKNLWISFVMNVVIALLVLAATLMGLFDVRFSGTKAISKGADIFKFFTVQSNILAAFSAIIMAIYEILLLKGKISFVPKWAYLFKLIGTVGVALTMFTVLFYLAPIMPDGYFSAFYDGNLVMHLLAPLLSILSFVLFEHTGEIRFRETPLSVLHAFLYGFFYMANAFSHVTNGEIPSEYNWYGFADSSVPVTILVSTVMLSVTFGLGVALWALNKKIKINDVADEA
ncbi:MAG: hypothetical protein J5762_01745 [Clostridia bacterium]|nr:hypothetical protein [Clostridia bacterium]